ncbi:aminotransferase [Aestuariivirga litoralis]|uniref:Aminotransferase n=1 Tax=Aestuariivirga litoralis TaxID=2650924 RepID=A0A2W2AL41_9HYPH|nr:aminotransferase [Aestuariivirga litoralis]PZF76265.1 aminotransferase [Aestuariivirga litoralis]
MTYAVNPAVNRVEAPPIMEAQTWVRPGLRNRKLLNLCQAVPSWSCAEELDAEVARLAHEPGISLYTDIYGIPELRAAIADHFSADYQGKVVAENVCVTAGCNQAFAAALMAIAKAGDNVILPVPYFFNHTMWLGMLGVEARLISGLGQPDPAEAAKLIDDRTRAIVLCSPNNPTGAIYSPDTIKALFELARARGIALVIDETYKDFRDGDAPAHPVFAIEGWEDAFIHLYSFSKAFAMTGYRVGAITASAPVLAEIEKIMDCLAICTTHISQRAALFALRELAGWKRGKIAMMHGRLAALRQAFGREGLRYQLVSSGALFAYVRHPFAGENAKQVAMRLAGEHDLLCLPGSMFGPGQEQYLRIAFANAEASDMETLVDRLIESQGR